MFTQISDNRFLNHVITFLKTNTKVRNKSELTEMGGKLKRGTLHIFIAGPNSVMFYLGMQSIMYGKVQLYEYDVTPTQEYGGSYYPTISFPQEGEF